MTDAQIDKIVGGLTPADTEKMIKACLQALPEAEAWMLVKDWIRESGLADDAAVEFGDEP